MIKFSLIILPTKQIQQMINNAIKRSLITINDVMGRQATATATAAATAAV